MSENSLDVVLSGNERKNLGQGLPSYPCVPPSKGCDNMKFTINGNKLKEYIESALLKGKWNYGQVNKTTTLNSSIIISISDEPFICNGDHSSYVKTKIQIEDEFEKGRVTLDTDMLLKYLRNDNCTFTLKDNTLTLMSGTRKVTMPVLDRHQYNDAILDVNKNYVPHNDMKKSLKISNRTELKTRVKVASSELTEALKACEVVGNSTYKLDYDGEKLIVSSNTDNENIAVDVTVMESFGPKATMEFSAPIHKYLGNVSTILSYNDDSPLSVICGGFTMLRAPRVAQ